MGLPQQLGDFCMEPHRVMEWYLLEDIWLLYFVPGDEDIDEYDGFIIRGADELQVTQFGRLYD